MFKSPPHVRIHLARGVFAVYTLHSAGVHSGQMAVGVEALFGHPHIRAP